MPQHRLLRSARRAWSAAAVVGLLSVATLEAAPPAGFVVEPMGGGWSEVAGAAPLEDGRMMVWERAGAVWIVDQDGKRIEPPLLDLRQEVGGWRDHGLLGAIPDPDFLTNGRFYLLYVVDRHHLLYAGTPQYDPNADEYFAASIGRITRYTAQSSTGFTTVDPASRKVLLGETKATGIPVVHQSHSVGSLLFGEDGTLLASIGDNASYEGVDVGGQVSGGYVNQAVADGILTTKENVGAFRSQLVDSHCGKVLRIDPETGDGVPSNPFYDQSAPRAPRSRVWCLGLRNPCRMAIEADSGSHDPAVGDPGTLLIGDVGWNLWEEIDVAEHGGRNFGWPIFEGLEAHPIYAKSNAVNLDAPNPLAGAAGCGEPVLRFRTLLVQDGDPAPLPLNPCAFIQAEKAVLDGAAAATAVVGYHGDSYVSVDAPDGSITWTVPVSAGGPLTLGIRYANGGDAIAMRLRIDGAIVADPLLVPSTGDPTAWRLLELPVNLAAGTRVIRLEAVGTAGLAVDALGVYAAGSPPIIDPDIPSFVHARPIIDWRHTFPVTRVPGYAGGAAVAVPVSGALGEPFAGFCAMGGPHLDFKTWPEEWHHVLLGGDFVLGWIRAFRLESNGAIESIALFDAGAGNILAMVAQPVDESLWIVRWPGEIVRVRYLPGGSSPPNAVIASSQPWGTSPLTVRFDAGGSTDPEGAALTASWDFGDGSPIVVGTTAMHTFVAPGQGPEGWTVTLTVADPGGATDTASIVVSANNSPPQVAITSFVDGQLYAMDGKTILPLEADVVDLESPVDDLTCSWRVILHHNTHEHPEPPIVACSAEAVITPLGCDGETYYYEIRLTVSDPSGLATTVGGSLFPDCKGTLECPADIDGDGSVAAADLAVLLAAWGPVKVGTAADLDHDGVVGSTDLTILLAAWGDC